MRRFGDEVVAEGTPEEHLPLLASIKKNRERRVKGAKAKGESTGNLGNTATSTSRFERALNSESETEDDEDEDEDDTSIHHTEPAKSVVSALSKKLSLHSIHSLRTERIPNLSRKQQHQLLQHQMQQQQQQQKKRSRHLDSDDEAVEDDYDVKVADGKLFIGTSTNEEIIPHQAIKQSFTRSADGKRVKFARGTKEVDGDDGDSGGDEDDKRSIVTKSTAISKASSVASKRSSSNKGDARKRNDKYDPYAYVPIQRAGKKQNKGEDKYFMKRR